MAAKRLRTPDLRTQMYKGIVTVVSQFALSVASQLGLESQNMCNLFLVLYILLLKVNCKIDEGFHIHI